MAVPIECNPIWLCVRWFKNINIQKELSIATKYKIFFEVFGKHISSSFSKGSTKPNIGETNIVPSVAVIPICVSSFNSLLNIFKLSVTHEHNPAIIPVNPASGPILAPIINGTIEDMIDGNKLLYEYL